MTSTLPRVLHHPENHAKFPSPLFPPLLIQEPPYFSCKASPEGPRYFSFSRQTWVTLVVERIPYQR